MQDTNSKRNRDFVNITSEFLSALSSAIGEKGEIKGLTVSSEYEGSLDFTPLVHFNYDPADQE